jgi:IS5 family transposase
MHRAIVMLGALARKHGVKLRQSYIRVAKGTAIMVGRYAHAKQWKRHCRALKLLRTRLGRLIRDIRRKIECQRRSKFPQNGRSNIPQFFLVFR